MHAPRKRTDRTDWIIGLRLDGSRRVYELPLRQRGFIIGTGSWVDLRIPDLTVSRMHCALLRKRDGRILVIDQQSRNGTRIDGVLVEKGAWLHVGARLELGETTLIAFSEATRGEQGVPRGKARRSWR